MVESLENREMLTAVTISDYEQLILELVNRARMDPLGEVALNSSVSTLNQGLDPGTISTTPKQPLASVQELADAGATHALDMLAKDYFSHYSQPSGATPTERATAAGYSGSVGENIAWNGSTGSINLTNETLLAHANLFASPSHRQNMMHPTYEEFGVGVEEGVFTDGGNDFNAVMVAEEFGFNSGNPYLTGVAFDDSVVNDDFYSVGESESGILVKAVNNSTGATFTTLTGVSGGYNVKLPAGTYTVTASGGTLGADMVVSGVTIGSENVKVDFDTSTAPTVKQDLLGFNIGEEFWVGESTGSSLNTVYYGDLTSTTTYTQVATGDFNGDGKADIVARSDADGSLLVSVSTGSSSFNTSTWGILPTITDWEIFVGDFTGDGLDDVMGRAASDGTFWLAESNGGSFSNSYWGRFVNTVDWQDMRVGDFNGDGMDDIAGRANTDGTWWVGASDGSSLTNSYWGRWSTGITWHDVSVGDFNGDGMDDIAGRANNAYWWINRSSGDDFFFVEYWGSLTATVTWEDVTVGDYNGDGMDDIAGRANGQWWLTVSTGTNFTNQYWGYWTTSTGWNDVRKIDYNGDGNDDLIGRADNGQWWVFESTGSVFLGNLVTTWSPGATWTHVFAGDFS